jgi:hypothetical protein
MPVGGLEASEGSDMNRVCVIDIAGASCRLVRRDPELWVNHLPLAPRPMAPTFPALAPSVQASLTTGVEPGAHGVVAGGLFRRQSHSLSFDERSNTLLTQKRFWQSRRLPRRPTTALVCWSNSLAGAADVALGAHTYGPSCCELVGQPMGLYEELRGALGECSRQAFRGPEASWTVSAWIASAAEEIWRRHRPDLQWVYMPGVDFEVVRWGPSSPQAFEAMRVVDLLARRLARTVQDDGGVVIVLSDGGYVPVHRVCLPNVRLREAGLLRLTPGESGQRVDLENSRAFAMVDHQIAHVFCQGEDAAAEAGQALAGDPTVAAVSPREALIAEGPGRERAGELILLAAPDAWFSYAWWSDGEAPPPGAFLPDMRGKCGYDPCELAPGDRPGAIDPSPARIRASRGLTAVEGDDQCLLASTCALPGTEGPMKVTDIPRVIREILFG